MKGYLKLLELKEDLQSNGSIHVIDNFDGLIGVLKDDHGITINTWYDEENYESVWICSSTIPKLLELLKEKK